MVDVPLILIAGILGSSHCIGMCGPFALAIGNGSTNWKSNLGRQTVYTLGRVFTYCVLGAVAGAAGLYLRQRSPALVNVAALLAIAAGLLLLWQGLVAAQVIRRKKQSASGVCLASSLFAPFLEPPGLPNIFLAGLFTGLLPCGLVYGFLTLAASTGDLIRGAALMTVFGFGTAPVMVLTGCGGSLISLASRKHIHRVAAWCVVLTGLISIARGVGFVDLPGVFAPAGCPMCDQLGP